MFFFDVLLEMMVGPWQEVFMLFDRDEDGVLSFPELQVGRGRVHSHKRAYIVILNCGYLDVHMLF